ncbi:MAG: metallophosphoesterase family protein [Desulfobacterium sp.]|nr:metallophosphoesterase family protein [Desulfobacterium sp.]
MPEKIGIMADSHGKSDVIQGAISFLKEKECTRLYHLGDICDSGSPGTADSCVDLLERHGVIAVKGNNDHIVLVNHRDQPGEVVSQTTLDYLGNLAQTVELENVILAHSLPFVKELGPAGMIRTMGIDESDKFFNESPQSVLFRGHSHHPGIIYQDGADTVVESLSVGQQIDLSQRTPCVITCGALISHLCMIWEPARKRSHCLSFPLPGPS